MQDLPDRRLRHLLGVPIGFRNTIVTIHECGGQLHEDLPHKDFRYICFRAFGTRALELRHRILTVKRKHNRTKSLPIDELLHATPRAKLHVQLGLGLRFIQLVVYVLNNVRVL
jgi:hypothetical protein